MSKKRKGLDFDNLKLIPATKVPPKSKVHTPYDDLLRQIGKGQALILTEDQVSLATAAAAVRKLRKDEEFKHFTVTQRTINGEKRLYIINNEKQ